MIRKTVLIVVALSTITLGYSQAPTRGYTGRACGFDLDDDGIIGEPTDDCTICDGNTSTGAFTADPDGDGVDEDINFVDSGNPANDDTACGAPNDACTSIGWVLNGSNTGWGGVLDGSGDGAEGIVCVAGTHTSITMDIPESGLTAQNTRNSFEYPSDPFMIVGWDQDRDGSYPPFDTDDTALLDGNNSAIAAITNTSSSSYIEIAHLEFLDYDSNNVNGNQHYFGSPNTNHLFFHDWEMDNIHRAEPGNSSVIVFDSFQDGVDWFAVENLESLNQGGYLSRGACAGCDNWRFSELTVTWISEDTLGFDIVKPWDTFTGYTIENSIFRSQAALWTSGAPNISGIVIAQCTQNVTIRNNELYDFHRAVHLQPNAGPQNCQSRPLDNITIDGNRFHQTYAPLTFDSAISLDTCSGAPDTNYIDDVTIVNNFFSNTVPQFRAIEDQNCRASSAIPGTFTIAGNTFTGNYAGQGVFAGDAPITVNNPVTGGGAAVYENVVIQNNIVSITGASDGNIFVGHAPTNFIADGNIFTSGQNFVWNNTTVTSLANWRAVSGADANSTECTPTFVNSGAGDLHLMTNDTCAIGAGVNITSITALDIDRNTRSAASPDSGAHEVQGSGQAPSNPVSLRTTP